MMSVYEIAHAVRTGRTSAIEILEHSLPPLVAGDRAINAVTRVLAERARAEAAQVDALVAAGRDPGPLAGVPYGVKDLFDVAGLPTTAGSSLYAEAPPATRDAQAIERLRAAGAVLVATLNMDEFAYGFATINARHGTTCNPHALDRLAGGSSGGSAAVVAAGLLPFALGSDTNGSVRVPASRPGVYGLKPTHGALPMRGVFPFAQSFDDVGPFARSVRDLRLVCEALQAHAIAASRPLRVARLGGRFLDNIDPDLRAALDLIAPQVPVIDLPEIARARSAAFLITAYEGGSLHRDGLARDAMAFDPAVRDRLLAGALLPVSLYQEAQEFCIKFNVLIDNIMADYDVLLAPSAPCVAPLIADPLILIDGERRPARSDLGIHTQPISFAGLPSLAVPLRRPGRLPLGMQLIGRRGDEASLFGFAAMLEENGAIGWSPPPGVLQGNHQ